jgi:hypothetical protein
MGRTIRNVVFESDLSSLRKLYGQLQLCALTSLIEDNGLSPASPFEIQFPAGIGGARWKLLVSERHAPG